MTTPNPKQNALLSLPVFGPGSIIGPSPGGESGAFCFALEMHMTSAAKWQTEIYPILEPFKQEATKLRQKYADEPGLLTYCMLQLSPKVLAACREAGVTTDEVDLLYTFANMVFHHIRG